MALLTFAGGVQALTVDLPDPCGSCQGLTGSLEINDLGGTFSVKLTLNSDGYTGTLLGLNQVGFGGLGGWTSVSLVSSPTAGWADPVGSPTTASVDGPCGNVGAGGGKVCTQGFVNITGGGDFVWEFNVVGGTLKETPWHIGAQFADQAGRSEGKILSEEGSSSSSPIPEPTAALIFGVGVLAAARSGRRR